MRGAGRRAFQESLEYLEFATSEELEFFARRVHRQSKQDFGRTISLYTPLYLSNFCQNLCVYCGFHRGANILREKLSPERIRTELTAIYKTGIREVLLLTGEHQHKMTPQEIASTASVAREIGFKSVGIEVYPLSELDYQMVIDSGVNSLSLYQETYCRDLYKSLHLAGPKADFNWRYNAPKRAALAGMPQINIGALLGLRTITSELLDLYDHLSELMVEFPAVEWGVSLPRLQEATTWTKEQSKPITDIEFVKAILALRVAFPKVSIAISTRENPMMRKHLIPLGINKQSAGVRTTVGGYAQSNDGTQQFPIQDEQSVDQVAKMVTAAGYQPVFSNWIG